MSAPSPEELEQLVGLFRAGRHAELEAQARQLLERHPDFAFGWKALGLSLQAQGKDAVPAHQKAAALEPGDAQSHFNLGVALQSGNRMEEAVSSYHEAVRLKPDYAEAHNNLGKVLQTLGRHKEATHCFRQALSQWPDNAMIHNNLGMAQKAQGELEAAKSSFMRALQLNPGYAEAHNNLGIVLHKLGRINDAAESYRRTLHLRPDWAEVHAYLGAALFALGQFAESASSYRRALAIRPGFAEAHNNLGYALQMLGQFDEAIEGYRQAIAIKPDFVNAYSNLLFCLNYKADHADAGCLEEARAYGRMVSDHVEKRFAEWGCERNPTRLRVGVVSGDLRDHPVGYFLEGVLSALEAACIELIAYPTSDKADEFTERIRPRFVGWKPIFGLSDGTAARLIHDDGVHVLLDLSGHTADNRLPVFAWKPAPVAASWLGYFATTGVAEIDYLLADEIGVPQARQGDYTERIMYLPDTRLCFTPPPYDLAVGPLPALANGHLTFGSFQRLEKVNDSVLAAWGRILAALPDARLRWQCNQFDNVGLKGEVPARLRRQGIEPTRVEMLGPQKRELYLAGHNEVDVILDTFPYPGGTSTCEALWMGVPTVSLAGDTMLSRQGASLLTAAGLGDWVVSSVEVYVDKAVALAGDLDALARLRGGLRDQALASPVYDVDRFARNFETALWDMWRQWQSGAAAA